MRVLLDSTVLIDALRGLPAQQRIEALELSRDIPCTTAVNVEEVVRGLRAEEIDSARRLFRGLEILPLDVEEGWQAGEWRQAYGTRGMTLWQADCLIAAAARFSNAKVATGNPKDFPMEEVVVEHWPVGE
jgi:predicted nucleic acid-binding protein